MTPFPDIARDGGMMASDKDRLEPARVRLWDEPGPRGASLPVPMRLDSPAGIASARRDRHLSESAHAGGSLAPSASASSLNLPPGSATAPAGFVMG